MLHSPPIVTPRSPSPPSCLLGCTWDVPDVGIACVVEPTDKEIDEVDEEWPPLRRSTDWHQSWRWRHLLRGKEERFAAVGGDGKTLALWCSSKRLPIQLPSGQTYRLDNLEVHPSRRGGATGLFLLALIASRALEQGARMLVLAALPIDGLVDFYRGAGGVRELASGWNCPRNLIPFTFGQRTLENLRSLADALRQE